METITINTEYIRLQDLMKLANMVSSGGEAKQLIQDGQVSVNGELPDRRKPSCSKRISSRSVRVRWDFPVDRQTMASRRLVFPWAFSPQMTLHEGSGRSEIRPGR